MSSGDHGLLCALGAALLGLATPAVGQDDDLTLPPRIDDGPRGAELAESPAGRSEALEEIIVVGEAEWRLPDLGSDWRARAEEGSEAERIKLSFLPLYDPERDPVDYDPLRINPEIQRVGFIELFRIQFGASRE